MGRGELHCSIQPAPADPPPANNPILAAQCRGQGGGSLYAAFNAHSFEVRPPCLLPGRQLWCIP